MSTFFSYKGGTLRSTNQPAALFELAQTLVFAELAAAGDDPFISPRKVSMTISLDEGLININATLPILATLDADGAIQLTVVDTLGTPYSDFSGARGTLLSMHLFAALVELSLLMVASDQAQEVDDRSNRVQVLAAFERGVIELAAALPFVSDLTTDGDIVITAIDYLYAADVATA